MGDGQVSAIISPWTDWSLRSRRTVGDIGIFDTSRAHFIPDRDLYIELPDEAKAPGDGDVVVGRLNRRIQRCKQQLDAGLDSVFSSQKGMQLAKPTLRCSSKQERNRSLGKVMAVKYKVRESHWRKSW